MPVKLILGNPKVEAWLLSHQALNSLVKYEEETLAASGLTSQQFAVLMAIKDLPEPVTQKDVADWLDRNKNSVTMILDRMAKDGLIDRARDLKDRRAIRLIVNPKGEKAYQQARQVVSRVIAEVTADLSEREIQTFLRIMEKIKIRTYLLRRLIPKLKIIQSVLGEDLAPLWSEKESHLQDD